MKKAKEANDNNDYFPIWGTCLGFETLNVIEAGENPDILTKGYKAQDVSLALDFQEDSKKTRLFKGAPEEILQALKTEKITYNHHQAGVSPQTYSTENSLGSFFDIISTNEDSEGNTFISTVEGKPQNNISIYFLHRLYSSILFLNFNRFKASVNERLND